MPSMSTLPEFVASSKRSSVLLCRSLCHRLSAHCTMRSALLCPQNLRCACDRVSLESCVSLGAMLSEASSLGICTSSGVRPNLVSNRLRHVFIFIHIMLISDHSPILSSNSFFWKLSSHTYSNYSHNQCFFSQTSYGPLVIFRAYHSNPFGSLLFGLNPDLLPFDYSYLEFLRATKACSTHICSLTRCT